MANTIPTSVVARVLLSCVVAVTAAALSRVSGWAEALVERCVCCGECHVGSEECDCSEGADECDTSQPNSDPPLESSTRQRDVLLREPGDVCMPVVRSPSIQPEATTQPRQITSQDVVTQNRSDQVSALILSTSSSSRPSSTTLGQRAVETSPVSVLRRRLANIQPKVASYRCPSSASSSASSSDASSTSWEETHRHILVENAALRKRLEQTPPRVYDSPGVPDPRHLTEHQLRRVAILRHRDEVRAEYLSKYLRRDAKPQWR